MTSFKPPSAAWLDEVFESPPRRNIKLKSKSTTRTPHRSGQHSRMMYAEGNNELCALRLLEHLWRCRFVRRFKEQAFDLYELGGPRDHVIDILVELFNGEVHVLQIKAKRFLTIEVQAVLDIEKEFVESKGMHFHLWTNCDWLGSPISHSVNHIDRGYRFPAERQQRELIGQRVSDGAATLGPLLDEFGWDDVMSAAAHLHFFIAITKEINEYSPVKKTLSPNFYSFLFKSRDASASWWDSLPPTSAA
jgi:hypothetical protein